ncbi:ion channel protein [Agromyces archimandritae]|uniref:Ion channel protein n=1 Tax=Agromyces archimandritae TaxID=2781962 RepID=A0A975FNB7_9MICO|nr:ion channel protein [Agromyces archimandritae]QTX05580.1 ion channel protein [Agromyces archimandritae]
MGDAGPAFTPRVLLSMSLPAIVIGIASALVLWLLDRAAALLQAGIWTALPAALGFDPAAPWWILLVLTATGFAVGLVCWLMPGHGGPDSATVELIQPAVPLKVLPGIALASIIGLAGGVSLGPESPIIAINGSLLVALMARFAPGVPPRLALMLAASATLGALIGTPVAAALLFTGMAAAIKGEGSLWDKLFLPLVAAGAGTITFKLTGAPPLAFSVGGYGDPHPVDILSGAVVACATVAIGLVALWLFPRMHRAFHALRHPLLIPTAGGLVLGVLGIIGGPITLFKGLEETAELLEHPGSRSSAELAAIAGVKILALLVAASAAFRGGRLFPATFIGVALGLLAVALVPSIPLALAVSCGVLGMILVVGRDGWLAIFMAVTVAGDIAVLPLLCVIILPAWLMVSRVPEFLVRVDAGGSAAPEAA